MIHIQHPKAAEIVAASLAKSFHKNNGQSVLSLRGGNVIGGVIGVESYND